MGMAWLISEARVFASVEIAHDRRARMKGLLGRDGLDGALVIPSCHWVHTVGMKFPIDIAYVNADNVVIKTETLRRHRIGMPVSQARMVIEAQAGAFERWGLRVGDPLEIRDADPDLPR
jgi:uncharacterized membrane protein (UPF0127 family)